MATLPRAEGFAAYFRPAPLAAFALGLSSGFPLAMILSTLTTRLAQSGITKSTITEFGLAVLLYNLKFLWAPAVDRLPIPLLTRRFGQRRSWLFATAALVALAVFLLGAVDPRASLPLTVAATLFVAFAGATFDIVIDAYRIELLPPEELGAGSGMSQYGYRLGNAGAGGLALVVAGVAGWTAAYWASIVFVLPALATGLLAGEPASRRVLKAARGLRGAWDAVADPLADFLRRPGALVVLAFVLVHKIGDTLALLTVRLLVNDLGFTNAEIATWDVGLGLVAFLVGIFVGGLLYAWVGVHRAVMISLVLMAVSNLGFAGLALAGDSNAALAAVIGFENFASGIGGVAVVAYLSALCDLRFTGTQFALLSAAASVLGRLLSSRSGALIERLGYVDFYLLTTLAALPGVVLFGWMMARGLSAIPRTR